MRRPLDRKEQNPVDKHMDWESRDVLLDSSASKPVTLTFVTALSRRFLLRRSCNRI